MTIREHEAVGREHNARSAPGRFCLTEGPGLRPSTRRTGTSSPHCEVSHGWTNPFHRPDDGRRICVEDFGVINYNRGGGNLTFAVGRIAYELQQLHLKTH
jgi:hypothetical protein